MRNRKSNSRGWTLFEMMIVVGVGGVLAAGFFIFFAKNVMYFKQTRVRQQVMQQSRVSLERIEQLLRNGKAKSLVISTPDVPAMRPNSRVDFVLQKPLASGSNAYAIYLEDGSVYGQEFRPGQNPAPVKLATQVTGLMFTGDSSDPGLVNVSIQIDAPYDINRTPPRVLTLVVPNRVVRMAEAP